MEFGVIVRDVLPHHLAGAFDRKLFIHGDGGDFERADPSAERNQVGQIRIAQADQLHLHIPLGGRKFLFQLRHVFVLGTV